MLPRRITHAVASLLFVLAGACGGEERPAEGERCGGWAHGPCAAGLYCEYPGTSCAEVDGVGTCRPEPVSCDRPAEPVCGCDGERYQSVCDAVAAGVDVVTGDDCGLGVDEPRPGAAVDAP